jgi:hypothetical protein
VSENIVSILENKCQIKSSNKEKKKEEKKGGLKILFRVKSRHERVPDYKVRDNKK